MTSRRIPDWSTARRIAIPANVDTRTILAVARGEHVRGDAGIRARAALVAAGFLVGPDATESAAASAASKVRAP
jgi:hypothetical protein